MERKNKNKETLNKIRVEDKQGLTVSYDKDDLMENFPHLVNEITGKRKFVKIESMENNSALKNFPHKINIHDELTNPRPIDFLRRCKNNDEPLEILDFFLKRKEISEEDYNSFKKQILYGEGLEVFIDKHGGFKNHGYYEKKYRDLTRNKSKQSKK